MNSGNYICTCIYDTTKIDYFIGSRVSTFLTKQVGVNYHNFIHNFDFIIANTLGFDVRVHPIKKSYYFIQKNDNSIYGTYMYH